jgi:hypothetical protein
MAGTLTIPLTTLPDGARIFGPAAVADADTRVALTVDRTPAGGLNSLTAATSIDLLVEQSNDGGATWFLIVDGSIPGGVQQAFRQPPGTPATSDQITVTFAPGTGRRARATMTVTGGPVAVQGSLTTS